MDTAQTLQDLQDPAGQQQTESGGRTTENLRAEKVSALKDQILYNPNFVLFPQGHGNSLTLTYPLHQAPKIPASVRPVLGF